MAILPNRTDFPQGIHRRCGDFHCTRRLFHNRGLQFGAASVIIRLLYWQIVRETMQDRISRLRADMELAGLDAVLLNSITAIRYFSSFTSDEATVVVTASRAVLLTDFRYTIQAKASSGDRFEIVEVGGGAKHLAAVKQVLTDGNCKRVGFEDDIVCFATYQKYEAFDCTLVPFSAQLHKLRILKTPEEVLSLKKAQAIADAAYTELLRTIHSGMTEKRVAAELLYICAKLGSEGPSFAPIVGSGPNGAMCHAIPSERKLQKGDMVVLDYGCLVDGYCSDMTRTFAVGEPDDFAKSIYQIVLDAQLKALDGLHAGITGKALDAIARDYIASKGYGANFGHSLGHGFGLLIHEAPYASVTGETTLEEGMTITVEPGIYIEDRLGVRIEDCCVVTRDGKLNLVTASKELFHID